MHAGGGDDRLMADINVTPFVDVMLVLLIIFMVTAPMMVQGVNVALPEVKDADPLPSQEDVLVITIDKRGDIYIADVKVTLDYLQEKLTHVLANRKNKDVYLRADQDIPYGVVVQAMGQIKGAGVTKLGMVTLPPAEDDKKKG